MGGFAHKVEKIADFLYNSYTLGATSIVSAE